MKNLPKIADIFLSLKSSVACESVGGKADSSNVLCCLIDNSILSKTFVGIMMTSEAVKLQNSLPTVLRSHLFFR